MRFFGLFTIVFFLIAAPVRAETPSAGAEPAPSVPTPSAVEEEDISLALLRSLIRKPEEFLAALEKYEARHPGPGPRTARILFTARLRLIRDSQPLIDGLHDPLIDMLNEPAKWVDQRGLMMAQSKSADIARRAKEAPAQFNEILEQERRQIEDAFADEKNADDDVLIRDATLQAAANRESLGRAVRSYVLSRAIVMTAVTEWARLLASGRTSYYVKDGEAYYRDGAFREQIVKIFNVIREAGDVEDLAYDRMGQIQYEFAEYCLSFLEKPL